MSTTIRAQKDVSRAGHEGYSSHGMAAYRASSLLQPHRARQAIADAHAGRIPPLIGFYCSWGSPPAAKVAAQLGYDFVWVDWEHAAMSVETMTQVSTCRAILAFVGGRADLVEKMVHDIQHISEGRSAAIVR
jgi:4-hydroxy-2-oxoheptanedioate aldolase